MVDEVKTIIPRVNTPFGGSLIKIPRGALSDEDLKMFGKAVGQSARVEIYDPLFPLGKWASFCGFFKNLAKKRG